MTQGKAHLVECLYFVGTSGASMIPRVCYELMGTYLGDFPDDGKSVAKQVTDAIRDEFGLGLVEAYALWKDRRIDSVKYKTRCW